jgi:hypothetical protein
MKYRRAAGGLLAIVLADTACFDSDQTVSRAATTGTTGDATSSSTTTPGATTGDTTTGGSTGPFDTCRDAIDCVFQCVAQAQAQDEPDLSCILECEETLSVEEVKKLLELVNCASGVCRDLGECASGESSSSGGESSSGGSSSSSSGGPTDPPLIDPCLGCVFTYIQDEESPGCEGFAMACP